MTDAGAGHREDAPTLNREQLLTRLCALGKEVQDHLGYSFAADCFCGENELSRDERCGPFRWDAEVIDFIDAAVRLATRGAHEPPPDARKCSCCGQAFVPNSGVEVCCGCCVGKPTGRVSVPHAEPPPDALHAAAEALLARLSAMGGGFNGMLGDELRALHEALSRPERPQ